MSTQLTIASFFTARLVCVGDATISGRWMPSS